MLSNGRASALGALNLRTRRDHRIQDPEQHRKALLPEYRRAPVDLNSGRIVVVRIELEVKSLVVLVTYVMRLCIGSPAKKEPVTYLCCLNAYSTDFVRLAYQSSKSS